MSRMIWCSTSAKGEAVRVDSVGRQGSSNPEGQRQNTERADKKKLKARRNWNLEMVGLEGCDARM